MTERLPYTQTPVTVLSGFLGSGKTTVLNRVLRDPRFEGTAVIVNEFGDIGVDHELIENAVDDVILLKSGCICCSIRGDLGDTLMSLQQRSRLGVIAPFSRVLVETSGLADPTPILHTLMEQAGHLSGFRHSGLIVTIDAVNGPSQIEQYSEAVQQVALADHILITKGDLATPEQMQAVRDLAASLNSTATISEAVHGEPNPTTLFESAAWPQARRVKLGGFAASPAVGNNHSFRSSSALLEQPVDLDRLSAWLSSVLSLRGTEVLRVKGIVNALGHDRPVAVHGVRFTLYPPEILPRWPDGNRFTRLVCIANSDRFAHFEHALKHALH